MNELTPRQKRALAALLLHPTAKAAAKAAGIGLRTIMRYLSNPHFNAALKREQDMTIKAASAALAGLTGDAIHLLATVIRDETATAAARVRAAIAILDASRRAAELDHLTDRVSTLERALTISVVYEPERNDDDDEAHGAT